MGMTDSISELADTIAVSWSHILSGGSTDKLAEQIEAAIHSTNTSLLEENKRQKDALEMVQISCCYKTSEDENVNVDQLLTVIRRYATEGLGEKWTG